MKQRKQMDPPELIEKLFDNKIVSILKFFLKNEDKEFYLREISRETKVSPASTYRILGRLVELDVLKLREIKTAKLYTLEKNKATEFLSSVMEVDVVEQFVEQSSKLPGVEEIILLGEEKKDKANILVLGTDVDAAALKLLIGELKEKYGFSINQMTLARTQYEQMSDMGLYPGRKKILFRKT